MNTVVQNNRSVNHTYRIQLIFKHLALVHIMTVQKWFYDFLQAHNHSRASNIQSNYCIRQPVDEDSSYSSSYSSFFKTDTESGNDSNAAENKAIKSDNVLYNLRYIKDCSKFYHLQDNWQRPKVYPLRKRDPPWLEAVSVTPELIYRYQMAVRRVEDILEEDLNSLKQIHQVRVVAKTYSNIRKYIEKFVLRAKFECKVQNISNNHLGTIDIILAILTLQWFLIINDQEIIQNLDSTPRKL